MLKKVFGRKLSRERDTRRALFRSLTRALVLNGKIKTTRAKAKAVQPFIDKLIGLSKDKTTAKKRKVFASLGNDKKVAKIISEKIVPSFEDRESGFTRIINLPNRKGDFAKMVRLEWIKEIVIEEKKEEPDKKKKQIKAKESSKTKKKEK